MPIEHRLVEVVAATAVRVGDTIWVHDDRDWMKVARIARNEYERTFYRADTSEATFDKHDMAVRLVPDNAH